MSKLDYGKDHIGRVIKTFEDEKYMSLGNIKSDEGKMDYLRIFTKWMLDKGHGEFRDLKNKVGKAVQLLRDVIK